MRRLALHPQSQRRGLAAVGLAMLLATAGCATGGGGAAYVLTADDVTGEVGTHATADLQRYERGVAQRLAARTGNDTNATVETVGWHPLDNGSYVRVNGSFYRIHGEQTGQRTVQVPHLALVPANGSADLTREAIPEVDQRATGLAVRHAQRRAEANGTVQDVEYAFAYHYGVEDSRLLDANGSLVRAFDETYRVVVFEAATEADVYAYRAERVATNETAFTRVVARTVTLAAEERAVLETARNGSYRVDREAVEADNATAFTGLLAAAGMDEPEPYGVEQTGYVRVDGRVYLLSVTYESAE